jgi:hypothetical protein
MSKYFLNLITLVSLGATVVACASKSASLEVAALENEAFYASCADSDQADSFLKPHLNSVYQVDIDEDFSAVESSQIAEAAREWNSVSQETSKTNFFNIQKNKSFPVLDKAKVGECTGSPELKNQIHVVRISDNDRLQKLMGMGKGGAGIIPAVTLACTINGEVQHQIILINSKANNPTQFRSVVLHEFGHAFGLDHSCVSGAGMDQYKSCAGLGHGHPYRDAVLFPFLFRTPDGELEVKEVLQSNDRKRALCRARSP